MSVDKYLLPDGDHDKKTYIVLGAHRSGTSFLIRALREIGVYTGPGGPPTFEQPEFVQLNMEIIQAAGSIWRTPPAPEKIIESADNRSADIGYLLRKYQKDYDYWGWKDPRQSVTIEGWVPYILEELDDVYLVAIFRRPERTAASLRRLGQHSRGEWFAREYARRIIRGIERFMGL